MKVPLQASDREDRKYDVIIDGKKKQSDSVPKI
jgi:hypothetical protein